jgi:DNA-binding transcriptional regulator YhcF (GntR family)
MKQRQYKYNRVVQLISEQLLPQLLPGDLLPSVEALCEMAQVSTITVNKALKLLCDTGKIKRVKNKGSVVLAPTVVEVSDPSVMEKRNALLKRTDSRPLRLLGLHPYMWNFMGSMEQILESFRRFQPEFEYCTEYPHPHGEEWIEQLKHQDYDLVFVNAELLREISTTPELVARILPLDELSGLQFSLDAFHSAAAIQCRNRQNWLAVPLTAAPALQIINPRYPGLESPDVELPRQWNDFWSALREIRHDGRPGFYLNISLSYLDSIFRMHNLQLFSADGRRCEIDRPEIVALMEELCHLIESENLILPSNAGIAGDIHKKHELIFDTVGVRWSSALDFSSTAPNKWRIAPLPVARRPAAHLFIEGVMVGKDAQREKVVAFLNYLQSTAAQSRLAGCAGISCRCDFMPLQLLGLEANYQGIGSTFAESLAYASPCAPVARSMVVETITDYLSAVCNGLISPSEACRIAGKKANEILAKSSFFAP